MYISAGMRWTTYSGLPLRYTVLGLGDTNYTNFCAMGKNLHQRYGSCHATFCVPSVRLISS